ncbi:adenylyltransferase/cytidyltransferase family protein [Candidatus Microgenomates bacterium]|nr:adenylyltransferase/cytidyltransferase family protein [Candidatus Microgenomates bacterium]
MAKIISLQEVKKIPNLVLVGGCFDLLHPGHLRFFRAAKKKGERLVILLESDLKAKKLKGNSRPIFNQKERAEMLASLEIVDYVIFLPYLKNDLEYDNLIRQIKPAVIAATGNDPLLTRKKNQAENFGAVLRIIPFFKNYSSSKLAKILGLD